MAIPVEMTHYPSWVVWRYEDRNGKPTKMPYSPRTHQRASVTEPSHWGTYHDALTLWRSGVGSYSGIGFVLSERDPYAIIDLDDPSGSPQDTEIAKRILETFDTYSEISPSGNGMHIILHGSVPGGRRRGKVELYSTERYFTMTGHTYRDAPIGDNDYFLARLWEELAGSNHATPAIEAPSGSPQRWSDEEVYTRASNSNEKFLPLFQGKYQEWYNSQSEADFALVNIISFFSRNPEQIARLFLYSELGKRPKAHRKDYLKKMIDRSFDNLIPDISLDQLMGNLMVQLEQAREKQVKEPPPVFGEGWTLPPGLIGEIAKFIYEAAPRPVQEIALAGAIGLMAGICGRAYNVSSTGLNQYILVLATTGRGKEAAKAGMSKLMRKVSEAVPSAADFIGPADIASGQALVKYMSNNPCFVSILGEFGLTLQQMCAPNASSSEVSKRKVILDLFGKSGKNDTLQQTIYSDKSNNTAIIHSPAFSILGETTPDSFYPHLNEDIIAQGLFPRFTCIEYTGKRGPLNKAHSHAVPSPHLVSNMIALCSNVMALTQNRAVIDVVEDEEGAVFIEEFNTKCDTRINGAETEVARQLWTRAHMKLLKLSALIAVGVDYFQPVITKEIAQWACNMVEKDIVNVIDRFESGKIGRDSNEKNQADQLLTVLKDYVYRPFDDSLARYGVNEKMKRDRVVQWHYLTKRLMQKNCFRDDRMGATFALKRAMDNLISAGVTVEMSQDQMQRRYSNTGKAYFISNVDKLD
jgi:hypothetical protein